MRFDNIQSRRFAILQNVRTVPKAELAAPTYLKVTIQNLQNRSVPPFHYPADSSNSAKGGTVGGTATLDHAFLPAVRSCKTEHLNDSWSNVSKTVLCRNTGTVLCIVLDGVLNVLIIDNERNGVE